MQSAQPLPDDEAATALAAARAEALALREQLSKVERRLQAREGLLKGLSQHIPGVLFKVLVSGDGDTRMVYISERAAEIYELGDIDPQTLTWASHYVRIHPDDLAMVQDLSRSVCEHPGELSTTNTGSSCPARACAGWRVRAWASPKANSPPGMATCRT